MLWRFLSLLAASTLAAPAKLTDARQPRALQHEPIDGHQRQAAGPGKHRDLGTQRERVEDARSERKRNDVITHCPPKILVHLAQRGPGRFDRTIGAFHRL